MIRRLMRYFRFKETNEPEEADENDEPDKGPDLLHNVEGDQFSVIMQNLMDIRMIERALHKAEYVAVAACGA